MKRLGMLASVALFPELVGILFFKVHSIHALIVLGVSSIILLVLGYLGLVIVELFKLFWESIEGYNDSLIIQPDFPDVLDSYQLQHATSSLEVWLVKS